MAISARPGSGIGLVATTFLVDLLATGTLAVVLLFLAVAQASS